MHELKAPAGATATWSAAHLTLTIHLRTAHTHATIALGDQIMMTDDGIMQLRMLIRERNVDNRVPCPRRQRLEVVTLLLGIKKHNKTKSGIWQWELPVDWPRRVREAGIDPDTLELVDLAKWQLAVKAIEQRRELKIQEKAHRSIQDGLRESCAKYHRPPALSPSQLIANHALTGRIIKHLRQSTDNT